MRPASGGARGILFFVFIEILVWSMLGLILGSFANVLILREGTGEGVGGRSHCPKCRSTLKWFELFPVLSFFMLRGACRTCREPISWQYPVVEICMALGAVLLGLAPLPLFFKVLGVAIFLILLSIAVYDLRTTYIPNRWIYTFMLLSLIYGAFLVPIASGFDALNFLAAGLLVAAPLAALWFFSRGTWMGFGDVKLVIGFGWLLGLTGGYLALALAFVSGAVVGLVLIGITRLGKRGGGFTMKSEVPFGPFLIFSLCIVWFSELYEHDLFATLVDFLSLN